MRAADYLSLRLEIYDVEVVWKHQDQDFNMARKNGHNLYI